MDLTILNNERVLTESGVITLVEELKKYINAASNVIQQYESIYEFPTVGSEKVVYIDKSSSSTYRWDAKALKYYCVGESLSNIEIINGGNASL